MKQSDLGNSSDPTVYLLTQIEMRELFAGQQRCLRKHVNPVP
jgi:hypothetical protein